MNLKDLEMEENKRWTTALRRINQGIFFGVVVIEILVSILMYFQGLIHHELHEYILKFILLPIGINALITGVGSLIIRLTKNQVVKNRAGIIILTLMCCVIAFVHNIYMVTLLIFAIPNFLLIIFRDKKLLRYNFILSECAVILIGLHCYISKDGAGKQEYYLPSVILIVLVLFVCMLIARACMNVLIDKNRLLMDALESAESANRSKSVFLSNMSHEIRTPINTILGMDEMILRETHEPNTLDYALDIQSSGKTLLGLINDILDFSKIEAGKMNLVNVEYDAYTMGTDLINSIAKRAYDKGLSFVPDISKDIPSTLYGDEIRIKQIIINMLTNAVKYTQDGSVTLKMYSEKVDDSHINLCVSVADTGQGIKAEDMERLLAPFERLEEKDNRNIEGTGLGMSITHNLLNLMGSKLEIESEVDKGSTFSFKILQSVVNWEPMGAIEPSHKHAKEHRQVYRESFTAPDAKILVVDDVPLNLKVIVNLLKQTMVHVETASSGKEALELCKVNHYNLIFIDHMMPEMDGIETLHLLNKEEYLLNHETVKIALTANAISGSREFYLGEGFSDYLSKPVEPKQLEKMILNYLPSELIHRK